MASIYDFNVDEDLGDFVRINPNFNENKRREVEKVEEYERKHGYDQQNTFDGTHLRPNVIRKGSDISCAAIYSIQNRAYQRSNADRLYQLPSLDDVKNLPYLYKVYTDQLCHS